MRHHIGIAAVTLAAGMSMSALGQDSVSNNGGNLPGDALSPWGAQNASYVLDLVPLATSQGNIFGVGPILKTSRASSANFNNLASASTISPDILQSVPAPRKGYFAWAAPGFGVSPENDEGSLVSGPASSTQFGVAMSSFATADNGASFNGIIGALVNFDPAEPNRLYVSRSQGAVNMASAAAQDSSQLGGVSIDANGNMYFRGDNDGNPAGATPLIGDNTFRTRIQDRDGNVNLISAGATIQATDRLIIADLLDDPFTPPNNIPASVAGTNGVAIGTNFRTEYVYGRSSGSMTLTGAHIDTTGGLGSDHRGSFATMIDANPFGTGDFTMALVTKDATGGTNNTIFNFVSTDLDGNVVDVQGFGVPMGVPITDNDDGFVITYTPGVADNRHFSGAVGFRGGVGSIAIGDDAGGNTLMAMTMSPNGFDGDFYNQIVVGRTDDFGTFEWTFAAWIDQSGAGSMDAGKPIFDGSGVEIGQLVDLVAVTGGTPFGPSISAPSIDAAGNVWFTASVELYDRLLDGSSDFDGALIRAVYDEATFSYRLELVLEVGTVVRGANSDRDYRIDFIGTAADSSTPSPGAFWGTNASQSSWNNSTGFDNADSDSTQGVTLSTSITYDVNDDGLFNNPTSVNFDPGEPADESYGVLMYLGYYQEEVPCPADLAAPFGVLNFFDLGQFLTLFNAQDPSVDFAAPFGVFNFFDLGQFLTFFNEGCP